MMSGQFSGFSEDDIKRVEKGIVSVEGVIPNRDVSHKIVKKTSIHSSKTKSKYSNTNKSPSPKSDSTPNLSIPNEARLSNPPINKKEKIIEIENNHSKSVSTAETVTNESKIEIPKSIDLETFQQEQKRMEEENRRRKELLVKALADRTEKTKSEAMKLDTMRKEVQKLDSLLSNDISILRKEIEAADIEYMQCQKRFERIEKEYKTLKKLVTQKREIKDLLTQHLCTIIQQNEVRKAEKLSQLMKELNLTEINNSI